jgi:hypothetical protein
MASMHWVAFSGSINTDINSVTDDPEKVTCILCKEWMEREKEKSNANDAR